MAGFAFHRALEALWRLLADVNQYLVAHQPWQLAKEPGREAEVAAVLWNGLEAVRLVAVALLPVMPGTARQVLAALGAAGEADAGFAALDWGRLPSGAALPETASLFPRVDKEEFFAATRAAPASAGATGAASVPAAGTPAPSHHAPSRAAATQVPLPGPSPAPSPAARESAPAPEPSHTSTEGRSMITIDELMNVELRVATVRAAEEVPKSSKLVKLTVDLGDEQRTVVAGIRQQYAPEKLVGRQVVVVANLQPAKLMGIESQGMVLAASEDGKPVLLHPESAVPPGTRVR